MIDYRILATNVIRQTAAAAAVILRGVGVAVLWAGIIAATALALLVAFTLLLAHRAVDRPIR